MFISKRGLCNGQLFFMMTMQMVVSAESLISSEVILGWESRYFTEGRDNLEGNGLAFGEGILHLHDWQLGLWSGIATAVDDYHELNASLARTFALKGLDVGLSFTHLEFFEEKMSDQEIGVSLEIPLAASFDLTFEAVYSREAKGWWMESTLGRSISLHPLVTLLPEFTAGWNEGYVAGGHSGWNHAAGRVTVQTRLTERLELHLFGERSWEIGSQPLRYSDDETLQNQFFWGVALLIAPF